METKPRQPKRRRPNVLVERHKMLTRRSAAQELALVECAVVTVAIGNFRLSHDTQGAEILALYTSLSELHKQAKDIGALDAKRARKRSRAII